MAHPTSNRGRVYYITKTDQPTSNRGRVIYENIAAVAAAGPPTNTLSMMGAGK